MTEAFLTTTELRARLEHEADSLNRLRKAEPHWKKADRPRGVKTIRATEARIAAIEAELQMATSRRK